VHNLLAFGFFSHDFGARNTLTLGYGHGDKLLDDRSRDLDAQLQPTSTPAW